MNNKEFDKLVQLRDKIKNIESAIKSYDSAQFHGIGIILKDCGIGYYHKVINDEVVNSQVRTVLITRLEELKREFENYQLVRCDNSASEYLKSLK